MMGFALGVASACFWSALDVARKAAAGRASPTGLAVFLLLGQIPLLAAWAMWDRSWVADLQRYWVPAVASMFLNALANVFFMRSVQLSPLSRTVPFLSLTPVVSALAAIPLLGEVPDVVHWSGVGLVVAGAFILNSDLADGLWDSLTEERGAPYMIAVAVLWSFSTALDKRALPHASPAAHAFVLSTGSAAILVTWLAVRGRLRELRGVLDVRSSLLVGMVGFGVVALGLQFVALKTLWVSVLETLKRAFGVLGSIAFGRVFFREAVTSRKLVAAGLMILGTSVLALL